MSDYISKIDATSVAKMKEAGAILIGTNNTHEFACGITNVNPHYGSSRIVMKESRDESNFLILSKQASTSSDGDKSPCLILSDIVLMLVSVIRLLISRHL